MGKAMEEYREVLETMVEATVKTIKSMMEQTKKLVERVEEGQVVEVRNTQRGVGGGEKAKVLRGMRMNYTQAVRRAKHEDIVLRTKAKMKQVIINNGKGGEGWKELSEKELVEKAKIARELMGIQGMDGPKVEFMSARKLKNGGVLYELNSTEVAEWLSKRDVCKAFLKKYGAEAVVKDRVYNVFVEFVPTSLGNMPAERLEMVEEVNGLHSGELTIARWAWAPQAWHANQRVAHLILACTMEVGANEVIKHGLVMEGKRVMACKLDQEPRQCLKCQRLGWGHIASKCK
ncbi:hypothetical protein J132_08632 [Termitomyces sp. J132]|nr:hypothetical protein J132_08632 [Termitomyces sp. J132]